MDAFLAGFFIGFLVFTPVGYHAGTRDGREFGKAEHAVEVSWPERATIDGKENISYQYDRAKWEPMGLIGDVLILKRKAKP